MKYSMIRLETTDRIGTITLCRPEKKNALNDQLVNELNSAFAYLETDSTTRVVVLKALGDVFSAGADLEYLQRLQSFSYEENLNDSNNLKNLLLRIHTHPKIVIAQVEGHAIAGGCGLAAVCDFCFAVPEALFGFTEVRIGFIPAIVSVFLSRRIRGSDVRELLLAGKLITAERALQTGLINAVVEKKGIHEKVREFAKALCEEASAQSLAATKELLSKIPSMNLDDALSLAAEMNAKVRGSEDCRKGIAAFLKKEKLTW